jgi:hypothetical protein
MSVSEFEKDPWLKSHPLFKGSAFNLPAPEFSTGEVILSSLYRASGFGSVAEKDVKAQGDKLLKAADKGAKEPPVPGRIEPDTWRTVLDRLIQSPKAPKQASKRFLSLAPIVPDTALYSGSARLSGNPWNPGGLIKRMIQIGATSDEAAVDIWKQLHSALSVDSNDDIWAIWLQEEFESRRLGDDKFSWQPTELDLFGKLPEKDRVRFEYPAKQFVKDLKGIVSAKSSMTRRQWVSLLEAVIRIGAVSHVLWLCDVHQRLWKEVLALIHGGGEGYKPDDKTASRMFAVEKRMLSFGHAAAPMLKNYVSKYLSARIGLNLVLWKLDELQISVGDLNSIASIEKFLSIVDTNRKSLSGSKIIESFDELRERETRTISCKKGIGVNLLEFALYTLSQRQTKDGVLRGYDQSYFLKKQSEARSAKWNLVLGPVSILAMAHCCLHEVNGPRSVQRLAMHLASYGVEFDLAGLNDSDLGRQLRMLGLVLDSPDAESGMLLVPPFAIKKLVMN